MGIPRTKSNTSAPHEDFLTLRGRNRPARLFNVCELPKPVAASVMDGGLLRWEFGLRHYEPPATLCFDFARLAHASDELICRFAQKWGPLGYGLVTQEEYVEEWRRYAGLADSILRVAAEHAAGRTANDGDWRRICDWVIPGGDIEKTAGMQLRVAVGAVNKWYNYSGIHVILDLVAGSPHIQPQAGGKLFAVLGAQIAHAIARADQMVVCAGCKYPFPPARPLSRGSRQYCGKCRSKKVPQRDASRDFRKRAKLLKAS